MGQCIGGISGTQTTDSYHDRETSDPSGTAQNEQNNKPRTAPQVPRDQINDIIWRGSKCLGVLYLVHA